MSDLANLQDPAGFEMSEDWPECIDMTRPILPEESRYGLLGEIVRAIEPHTEADPVAILTQTLVTFGNIIGRNAHFLVEDTPHHMNLFLALVGATSKSRKGTSLSRVMRLFRGIDTDWDSLVVEGGLSTGEGLIQAVQNPVSAPVQEVGDEEPADSEREVTSCSDTDKRLLVKEPELARVLRKASREWSPLSAIMRDAWDSGDMNILTRKNPLRVTGAHLSVIGHITEEELLRNLANTDMANGFANRFLWVYVARSKLLPEGSHLPDDVHDELTQKLRGSIEYAKTVGQVTRDKAARALWYEVYGELSDDKYGGLLGAITGRAEAQVVRLSALYALLDRSSIIHEVHLRAALGLWKYAEESARLVFGNSLGNPVEDKILDALQKSKDGLTRTDIRDLFNRNKSVHQIDQALSALSRKGLAHFQMIATSGRPAECWFAVRIEKLPQSAQQT